jgi:hypothetical protein
MTPHVLNGAFERVSRAEKHLTDLQRRINQWLDEQENAVVFQFEPKLPHNQIVDTSGCIGPPFIVGILIGEIAYNLRNALDYLIFELAKLDSGREQKMTQFPIENTKKGFDGCVKAGRLKGINPAHIAAIERLQPYAGCNWTGTLRDISNPDKHRELTNIKGSWTVHFSHRFNEPNAIALAAIPKPIRRTHHPIHGNVDVKLGLTATITLDDGTPIAQALEVIKLQVANTLTDFQPEF